MAPDTEDLEWTSDWSIVGTHGMAAVVDVAFKMTRGMSIRRRLISSVRWSAKSPMAKIATYDDINSFGVRTINNAPDGKKYYSPITGTAGVQTAEVEKEVKATRYFDLQGRPVAVPAPGSILIKVETLSDGTTRTTKTAR